MKNVTDTNANSRFNLIVDFNYFLHRALAVYHSTDAEMRCPKLTNDDDKALFARKVVTDLCSSIHKIYNNNLSNIILTIDSKSWRKKVLIEDNKGYKSNRSKKSTDINWEGFFEVANELADILSKNGMYIARMEGAEGDDLMYLYAKKFLEIGQDTLIITGDKDLWQVVDTNGNNFIAIYSNNSRYLKVVLNEQLKNRLPDKDETLLVYEESMSLDDIDNMVTKAAHPTGISGIDNFFNFIKSTGIEMVTVDPIKHVFNKIFIGDAGDAVPPLFTWESTGKKKLVYKPTELKITNIWNYMSSKYAGTDIIFKLPDEIDFIQEEAKRIAGKLYDKEELKSKIERNIRLVYLNEKVLPVEIVEQFNAEFDKIKKMQYVYFKFNIYNFNSNKMLSGTKYGIGERAPESDFFKKVKASPSIDLDDFFMDDDEKVKLV